MDEPRARSLYCADTSGTSNTVINKNHSISTTCLPNLRAFQTVKRCSVWVVHVCWKNHLTASPKPGVAVWFPDPSARPNNRVVIDRRQRLGTLQYPANASDARLITSRAVIPATQPLLISALRLLFTSSSPHPWFWISSPHITFYAHLQPSTSSRPQRETSSTSGIIGGSSSLSSLIVAGPGEL
jgi:hypothetical protein